MKYLVQRLKKRISQQYKFFNLIKDSDLHKKTEALVTKAELKDRQLKDRKIV